MTSFGLQIPGFSFGSADDRMFDEVVDRAKAGEDSGFASLWVMDHFYQLPVLGGPDQPILEGYTLLGALAARTERASLGTLVAGVTYRNPALLAKMVTTLDVISGGRAVLGIGAAWFEEEHTGLGFEFPPAKERLDRLEEALQVCRAMFREEKPTFEGRYYAIREARNVPRPLQPGGPPVLVGGGGERRTLRLVAQYADACNVGGDVDTVRHKVEVLHGHCGAVGRDPAEVKVTRLASLFLTQSAKDSARLREMVLAQAGPDAAAGFHVGEAGEIVEQLQPFVEAGVQEFIFNMPLANPTGIARAGEVLTAAFAS
jgi:F420-dependent oxidoreductase-like protein